MIVAGQMENLEYLQRLSDKEICKGLGYPMAGFCQFRSTRPR